MKIELTKPEVFYQILDRIASLGNKDESEAWKQADDELKNRGGLTHGPVELPYPFHSVQMNIRRLNIVYNADAVIIARKKFAFYDSSERFGEFLSKQGYKFLLTTSHGTGHIILDDKTVYSLAEPGNRRVRILSAGDHGSYPRFFGDDVKFCKDLVELTKVVDGFLNTLMEVREVKGFSGLVLHLNL